MKQYEYFLIMTTLAVGANVAIEKLQQQWQQQATIDSIEHCRQMYATTNLADCMRIDSTLLVGSGAFKPHELVNMGFYRHKANTKRIAEQRPELLKMVKK